MQRVVEANAITEKVTARIILPDNSVEMKKYALHEIIGEPIKKKKNSKTHDEEDKPDEEMKSILDD